MKKKAKVEIGRALMEAIMGNSRANNVPWYRRRMTAKSQWSKASWINGTRPHQGDREKARRMRQMAKRENKRVVNKPSLGPPFVM